MAEHKRFNIENLAMLEKEAEKLGVIIPYDSNIKILLEHVKLKNSKIIPNRFVIQPMEGYDAELNGSPGKYSFRRYKRYGAGGSGLIWFEACAVVPEARTNPNQFYLNKQNLKEFKLLIKSTLHSAEKTMGRLHKPITVLQLTHSGRYSKPCGKPSPIIAHHSPVLDPLLNLTSEYPLVSDQYLDGLIDKFVESAKLASMAGFDGVEIKSCHGYLVNELLASFTRKNSRYGETFENRTRLLKEICRKISEQVPEIFVTTRISAYDVISYPYGFGVSKKDRFTPDLTEPLMIINDLKKIGIPILNFSIGNPYFEPHFVRPFDYPTINAGIPEMHPLENIAKLIDITRIIQQKNTNLPIIGSGYSWLREFIPYVGAGIIKKGWACFISQGRNAFAYPDSVKDLYEKGFFDKNKVCISCSSCIDLMRKGVKTGCVINDSRIYRKIYKNNIEKFYKNVKHKF